MAKQPSEGAATGWPRASRALADHDRLKRADVPVLPSGLRTRPAPFVRFVDSLGLHLTNGQRVLARVVFDGVDPIDLPPGELAIARQMLGPDVDRIPSTARRVNVLRLGRGSGKTTLAAASALHVMLTADLSSAGPGDQPTVITIAPTRRTAQLSVSMAMGLVEQTQALRSRLLSANTEGFSLRRHDGRRVAFRALPKSRGGAAARGMSILSAIFDEAEFLPNEELAAAAVTDRELLSSIMPRLMRGGRVILISTPWPTLSMTAELFENNHGHPLTALAARAPTLLMRDNDPNLAEIVEGERLRDPVNALREFDCVNATQGAAFFDGDQISQAISHAPLVATGSRRVSVGLDLAFRGDSSTLVAVERQGEQLVVVRVEERRPVPGAPLAPSVVVGEFAQIARELGADSVVCDGHYIDSVREHASKLAGIGVHEGAKNMRDKERMHVHTREMLREGKLVLPQHLKLLAQLRAVRSRPLPGGGMSIVSDRSLGGHGDLVSALVQACYFDRRFGTLGRPTAERTEFTAGKSARADAVVGSRGRINDSSRSRW